MAVGFTTWTVLRNDPVNKLESNLWYVNGRMPRGNDRKMVVARKDNGELAIFNPIALQESDMKDLESFGKIAYLIVPNGFHRQDVFIWKQRYPDAKIVAPRGAQRNVAKAAPVDLTCDQFPNDSTVTVQHAAGLGDKETLMVVKHGASQTVVACDSILNIPRSAVGFPFSFLLAPLDTVSTPRLTRWVALKNKQAWKDQLESLAQPNTRLIPGHGRMVDNGAEGLRNVVKLLG